MKIYISTSPYMVDDKIKSTVDSYPDISLNNNTIYHKDRQLAIYEKVVGGVEVTVLDRPWYISKSFIESRLLEFFV